MSAVIFPLYTSTTYETACKVKNEIPIGIINFGILILTPIFISAKSELMLPAAKAEYFSTSNPPIWITVARARIKYARDVNSFFTLFFSTASRP